MTYREGVWVFDRSNGRIGRVLQAAGDRVLLMNPEGNSWTTQACALRLATEGERGQVVFGNTVQGGTP